MLGIAADILHLEDQLGTLAYVPVPLLRTGLTDASLLSLPPFIPK